MAENLEKGCLRPESFYSTIISAHDADILVRNASSVGQRCKLSRSQTDLTQRADLLARRTIPTQHRNPSYVGTVTGYCQ